MSEAKKTNKHDEIAKERAEIFETIYGVNRIVDILGQFEDRYNKVKDKSVEQVNALYRDYSYAIFFMYSPSAIRNNLVKFKNIIKKNGGKYKANAIEAFTIDNIYTPIKAKDTKVKKELKKELKSGKADSQNIDPLVIQKQVTELKSKLDNKKYKVARNQDERQVRAYHLVALLGLVTGRRFTEIIKTFDMRKRGTKLTFSGLLKGNDKTIEGNLISLSYKDTKKYLTELRKNLDSISKEDKKPLLADMTENQVNSRYSRVFNNAIKRLGFTNVKALRHNYSVAGSQLFKRENESIEDTITRILGHRETFTSALNYA
jgi:hypothetical protein